MKRSQNIFKIHYRNTYSVEGDIQVPSMLSIEVSIKWVDAVFLYDD